MNSYGTSYAPPKKVNWIPWVAGCGGCLVLVMVGVFALGLAGYFFEGAEKRAGVSGDSAAADSSAGAEGGEVKTRGVQTTTYTATREGLNQRLAANFVPFSFDYPAHWRVLERGTDADDQNFVKVERSTGDGFTSENFAVGYLTYPPGGDRMEAMRALAAQMERQIAPGFPNFHKVRDETASVAGREAAGFRFSSRAEGTPRGAVDLWGRVLMVPADEGRGVVLIMIASPVETKLTGPEDVGEVGELPIPLHTFRFAN